MCNYGCARRHLQRPNWHNQLHLQSIFSVERLHRSAIYCSIYKGGAIITANLSPHNDMSPYLCTLRLTYRTNAFRCPNQITPRPNSPCGALRPKIDPHSGPYHANQYSTTESNHATHHPFSKGGHDTLPVRRSHLPPHSLPCTYNTPGKSLRIPTNAFWRRSFQPMQRQYIFLCCLLLLILNIFHHQVVPSRLRP